MPIKRNFAVAIKIALGFSALVCVSTSIAAGRIESHSDDSDSPFDRYRRRKS